MKAVTWRGVNEIGVEDVPEPSILNQATSSSKWD